MGLTVGQWEKIPQMVATLLSSNPNTPRSPTREDIENAIEVAVKIIEACEELSHDFDAHLERRKFGRTS